MNSILKKHWNQSVFFTIDLILFYFYVFLILFLSLS